MGLERRVCHFRGHGQQLVNVSGQCVGRQPEMAVLGDELRQCPVPRQFAPQLTKHGLPGQIKFGSTWAFAHVGVEYLLDLLL